MRLSSLVPLVFLVGCVGSILAIHAWSRPATVAHLERAAQDRAAAAQADAAAQEARDEIIAAIAARADSARQARLVKAKAEARAAALAALPGDPSRGRMTFMTCMGCHGLRGEGSRAFRTPRLTGQHPWYLRTQLVKFRAGMRGSHPQDLQGAQMAPMARLLASESTLDDVVAFIARAEVDKPVDTVQGDAERGRELYAVCATCHGPDARGSKLQKAPNLAMQHGWYLERQLQNFRESRRGHDERDIEGQMMVPMARALPDDAAILDVIAYIQSLQSR